MNHEPEKQPQEAEIRRPHLRKTWWRLKTLPPEGDPVATSLRRCVSEMDYSRVRMTGIPQETYRLLRANSLAGPWETLTNITTGVDGFGQFLDANPPGDKGFYRAVSP